MSKPIPLTWDELKNYVGVPTFTRFETHGWPELANGKDGYWSIISRFSDDNEYFWHYTEDDTLLGETKVSREHFMESYQIFLEEYRGKVIYHKELKAKDGSSLPSREEIKQGIRTESFQSLIKKYGYKSISPIQNWCKKYNLPYLKSEINKYTDEEWDLL